MQHNKAQATIFIFLGILLLFTIVVLVFVYTGDENEIAPIQTLTQAEMEPIISHIETCLRLETDNALQLLGEQGFALYADQGGTLPSLDANKEYEEFLYYDEKPVRYLISLKPENIVHENPDGTGDIIISNSLTATQRLTDTTVLAYPWTTFPINPATGQEQLYLSSGFGWNHLPPLQPVRAHSIKEQMEGFIAANLLTCIGTWDQFPSFTITTNDPTITVLFGQSATTVNLNWIVKMTHESGREGTFTVYQTRRPVRLATIHHFINTLLSNDVSQAGFDIYQNDSDFHMYIERNYSGGGSVIRLVDPKSRIGSLPYEVRFARQNRPPALYYVDQERLNTPTAQYVIGSCEDARIRFTGTSLRVTEGDNPCPLNITIPFQAIDPDEEQVTFTITGRTGVPYAVTAADIAQPLPCIPYTVHASDGHDEDWQTFNIRLKSVQFGRCA
ncbi:hypothetical protein GF342_04215 [Candidatus Woesearchaeota archaeon]|nr:hypothetical protein [Candidatus Woesearchaeota archaeon]